MQLRDQLEADGEWLFRYRSYLPALLLPLFILALLNGTRISQTASQTIDAIGALLAATGVLIRAYVVGYIRPGTSGRNSRRQLAAHLNTTGLYSIVRHPLYVGNFLVVIGWAVASTSGWLVLVVTLAFILYYERIALQEESFLRSKFACDFDVWSASTPAFLPKARSWMPPDRSFSWSMIFRREYQTVALVVAGFATVHLLRIAFHQTDSLSTTAWLSIAVADAGLFGVAWLAVQRCRRWRSRHVHAKNTEAHEQPAVAPSSGFVGN